MFSTRLVAVFVVPKLAVLWTVLTLSLAVIAAGAIFSGALPRAARQLLPVDLAVGLFLVLSRGRLELLDGPSAEPVRERLQYQGLLTVLLYVGFFYVARLSLTDGAG